MNQEDTTVIWQKAFLTFQQRLSTRHSALMYICDNPAEMTEQPQPQRTKVSVFSRIRRSFRRKKESYCINCGHVTKNCYHSKDIYENVEFNNKDDLLKWLDLDLSHGHGINNNPIRHKYQVTGLALFPSHKLFRFLSLSYYRPTSSNHIFIHSRYVDQS